LCVLLQLAFSHQGIVVNFAFACMGLLTLVSLQLAISHPCMVVNLHQACMSCLISLHSLSRFISLSLSLSLSSHVSSLFLLSLWLRDRQMAAGKWLRVVGEMADTEWRWRGKGRARSRRCWRCETLARYGVLSARMEFCVWCMNEYSLRICH
jgi:hypothetical protein